MPELPAILGSTDSSEEALRHKWNTINRVIERLAKKGITVSDEPPPFPIPEVTTTLVDTDNVEYLRNNAKYLAWLNFILPHIALNEALLLEVRNEKTSIEAMYRDNARRMNEEMPKDKRLSKEEISDNILLDPRYVELTCYEQELEQEGSILEAKKSILARTLQVISRHIEVKKIDMEAGREEARVTMRTRHPLQRGNYGNGGGQ